MKHPEIKQPKTKERAKASFKILMIRVITLVFEILMLIIFLIIWIPMVVSPKIFTKYKSFLIKRL